MYEPRFLIILITIVRARIFVIFYRKFWDKIQYLLIFDILISYQIYYINFIILNIYLYNDN